MAQQLHPLSVIDSGTFVFVGGAADITNIAEDVNSADGDTTHILSFVDMGIATPIDFYLDVGSDPVSSIDHVIRFSAKVTDASGSHELQGTINNDTDGQIASFNFNLSTSYTVYEYTLSEAEADAITDFATLNVFINSPFDDAVELRISAVEFDMPDPIPEVVDGERLPPIADVDTGSWTSTGAAFFTQVQCAVNAANGDLEYIENTDANPITLALAPIPDPVISTGHKLRISAKRVGADDGGLLRIALKSDDNFVTGLETVTITEEYSIFEYTLSSGEADAITNYSTLEVVIISPNFVASTFRVSSVEFNVEAPLSPSGGNDMRSIRGALPTSGATVGFALPSGFGTPKTAIFIVSGASTNGTTSAVTRSCMSIGWTDGVNQRCWGVGNEGATAGNENSWDFASTIHCIAISNAAGGNRGLATFNSFGVDLITLNITVAFPDANLYTVWAVNGNGVLAKAGHTSAMAGGGAAIANTTPGFKPNVLIVVGDRLFTGIPAWTVSGGVCVGFAVDRPTGIQQVCEAWESVNNVAALQTKEIVASDCVSGNNATAGTTPGGKIVINSFDTLGFTAQNIDTSPGSVVVGYLALFIPNAYLWAGILDTPTSTGLLSYTQPALGPQAMFVASGMVDAVGTFKTDAQASSFGFGVTCGPTTALAIDGYATVFAQDADTIPMNVGAIADAKIGLATDPAGSTITADFSKWLQSGVEANFTAVAASARKWPALFIGSKKSIAPYHRPHRTFNRRF